MRKTRRIPKGLHCILLFCAVLLMAFKMDVSAMNQTNIREDFTFYPYNQAETTPSDYEEEFLVVAFGRTGCQNTRSMLARAEQVRERGYSVKSILMDLDSTEEARQSFANQNPSLVVAHHDSYQSQMWSLLRKVGGNTSSVTLPALFVLDGQRNIIAWSTGVDLVGLEQVLTESETGGDLDGESSQKTKYTITYNLNGGIQNGANPNYYYAGDTIVLQDPTREGYRFIGWAVDGYSGSYLVAIYPTYRENFSLTAVWEKIPDSQGTSDEQVTQPPSAENSDEGAIEPDNVRLNKTSARLVKGKSLKLRLLGSTGKISWESGDASVASISAEGKLKAKKVGKVKITAVSNGKTYTSTVTVVPSRQKITSAKRGNAGSVLLKWKKEKQIKGYQIRYATDKKFKKNAKTLTISKSSTIKKTINRLKKGKTYYFSVRSYGTWKGKKIYGDYSNTVRVKIPK